MSKTTLTRREVVAGATAFSAAAVTTATAATAEPAPAMNAGLPIEMTIPEKRKAEVLGHKMAYIERGSGDPIVFLHGNPTSSYLWRNIIPHLEDQGRCIAPDLIGMGDSDKIPPTTSDGRDGRYRFVEHRRYLDAFLEAVGANQDVTFVIHDWGSALGFDWAFRHPEHVKGIAYMEAFVRPLSLAEMSFPARMMFRGFRSGLGEFLVFDLNLFVEQVLPSSIMRELRQEEMDAYRRPFEGPDENRRPVLTWPREVPFDGEPADTHDIVSRFSEWLPKSPIPKLLIHAEPGALLQGERLQYARTFANQEEVGVKGIHFIQEDAPHEIGQAVADWRRKVG